MAAQFDKEKVPGFNRTLLHFEVLHSGWEMDNSAWVVELDDGSRVIVTTSHGGTYIAKPQEFVDKVADYEAVLNNTKLALSMLTPTDAPS